jgi:CTD kinase subunit beta
LIESDIPASKKLTKFAWRLTIDRSVCSPLRTPKAEDPRSQRTLVALQYPPHVVAIACIYLAALLSTFEQNETHPPLEYHSSHEIVGMLGEHGPWEKKFQAQVDDLEGKFLRHVSIGCSWLMISLRHRFSNLPYASRPADIPNTKSIG